MLDIQEELERVEAYTSISMPMIEELNRMAEEAGADPDPETALLISIFGAGALSGMVLAYKSVLTGEPISMGGFIPDSPEDLFNDNTD